MQSFDLFSKPQAEFASRTPLGGCLSLCGLLATLWLLLTELGSFLSLEVKENAHLDRQLERGSLFLNVEVHFHKVQCEEIGLAILDTRLRAQLQTASIRKEVYAQNRVNGTGPEASHYCDWRGRLELPRHPMKLFWTSARWIDPASDISASTNMNGQTSTAHHPDGGLGDISEDGGGGHLPAPILTTEDIAGVHSGKFSFNHTIVYLRFGPDFPGLATPLDGSPALSRTPDARHFQYDLHLIPTQYIPLSNRRKSISSHQYSVTKYSKPCEIVDTANGESRFKVDTTTPGLQMSLEHAPFRIEKVERLASTPAEFLTRCCALVGGVFAFSSLVDTLCRRSRRLGASVSLEIPPKKESAS